MKKGLILFYILTILLFSVSCNSKETVYPVNTLITFTAVCEYNNQEYLIPTEILENSDTIFSIPFYDGIDSFTVKYTQSHIQLTYEGLEQNISHNDFSQSTLTGIIYNVFKDCENKAAVLFGRDDFYITEGRVLEYEYKLYVSSIGLPIKLAEKNNDIIITFKDVSIINR